VDELWGSARSRRRADDRTHEQSTLDVYAGHELRLPPLADAEQVRGELAVLGLDVSRHVIAFYEPLFPVLGIVRASDLLQHETGDRIRVAGVKVAIQSPPVKSGQRVMFLSLDDRTGTVQCNFFERNLDDCAWTLLNAWLIVVEGRVRRSGPRGVTVLAHRAWDLTRLRRAYAEGWLREALSERGTPSPHERTIEKPDGLAAAHFGHGSPHH